MNTKQARNLLPRTIVIRDGILGTVRLFNAKAFFVDWEDGQSEWIAYDAAKNISIR